MRAPAGRGRGRSIGNRSGGRGFGRGRGNFFADTQPEAVEGIGHCPKGRSSNLTVA
jgi:hypothetical protein